MNDELSEAEQELLEGLEDPNDQKKPKKFKFEIEYQSSILSMIICDKVFLIQCLQLVKAEYFIERTHEAICRVVFEHFEKFSEKPTKNEIIEGLKESIKDEKRLFFCMMETETLISNYIGGLESRDLALEKIVFFSKEQALRGAISKSIDLLDRSSKDKFKKIEDELRSALLVDRNFDLGTNYFSSIDSRYDEMQKQLDSKETFVTGFLSIDEGLNGGLNRGEIGCFLGLSNSGKSLLMTHVTIRNLIRNKKCLYLSLEMNELKTSKRFDSQLAMSNIRSLVQDREQVTKELKSRGEDLKDKLIIKHFPAGSMDLALFRAYHSQLCLNGFVPDLITIDYIGEFKNIPDMKLWESREQIVREIRGYADENNFAVISALQSNRLGKTFVREGGTIDEENIGDGYGAIRPCDFCVSINQTQTEKELNLLRLFTFKVRDGASRYYVYLRQNPETLGYNEISKETYASIMSTQQKANSDQVEDIIKPVWRPGK